MDSSQASNQLENIGRFATDNNLEEYQDSSSMNLDSQVMVINNPANRLSQIGKQNSILSQIIDDSDLIDKRKGDDPDGGESSDFLPADFNLEHSLADAKGPHDLLSAK